MRLGRSTPFASAQPVAALGTLTGWALANGVDLPNLTVGRRSLEDLYLELIA